MFDITVTSTRHKYLDHKHTNNNDHMARNNTLHSNITLLILINYLELQPVPLSSCEHFAQLHQW